MSSNTLGNAFDWDYDFTVNTPINSAATACAYHTVPTYDQWFRDLASIEVAHGMHSPPRRRRRFIVRNSAARVIDPELVEGPSPPPYTEADASPPPSYRRPVFYKVIGRNRSGHPRRIRLN